MQMRRASGLVIILLAGMFHAGQGEAIGQTYPERVIEMINPYPAGGATDTMGRALAEGMSAQLGQRVIFLNRPGANGAIGTVAAARAAPDGYTVLFTAAVSMVVNPLTQAQTGYTL